MRPLPDPGRPRPTKPWSSATRRPGRCVHRSVVNERLHDLGSVDSRPPDRGTHELACSYPPPRRSRTSLTRGRRVQVPAVGPPCGGVRLLGRQCPLRTARLPRAMVPIAGPVRCGARAPSTRLRPTSGSACGERHARRAPGGYALRSRPCCSKGRRLATLPRYSYQTRPAGVLQRERSFDLKGVPKRRFVDVGSEELPAKLGPKSRRSPVEVFVRQNGGGVERHQTRVTNQFR